MRQIGNRVFAERFAPESGIGSISVSEGAVVANLRAVVADSPEGCAARPGDVVHLPHYGVVDAVVGGKEYAVFDAGEVFAVERGGDWYPVNGYVRVRKCYTDHVRGEGGEVAIYLPDGVVEETNWVEIVAVAGDCNAVCAEDVGGFCPSPEESPKLRRLGRTKDYMLHEGEIAFVANEGWVNS